MRILRPIQLPMVAQELLVDQFKSKVGPIIPNDSQLGASVRLLTCSGGYKEPFVVTLLL